MTTPVEMKSVLLCRLTKEAIQNLQSSSTPLELEIGGPGARKIGHISTKSATIPINLRVSGITPMMIYKGHELTDRSTNSSSTSSDSQNHLEPQHMWEAQGRVVGKLNNTRVEYHTEQSSKSGTSKDISNKTRQSPSDTQTAKSRPVATLTRERSASRKQLSASASIKSGDEHDDYTENPRSSAGIYKDTDLMPLGSAVSSSSNLGPQNQSTHTHHKRSTSTASASFKYSDTINSAPTSAPLKPQRRKPKHPAVLAPTLARNKATPKTQRSTTSLSASTSNSNNTLRAASTEAPPHGNPATSMHGRKKSLSNPTTSVIASSSTFEQTSVPLLPEKKSQHQRAHSAQSDREEGEESEGELPQLDVSKNSSDVPYIGASPPALSMETSVTQPRDRTPLLNQRYGQDTRDSGSRGNRSPISQQGRSRYDTPPPHTSRPHSRSRNESFAKNDEVLPMTESRLQRLKYHKRYLSEMDQSSYDRKSAYRDSGSGNNNNRRGESGQNDELSSSSSQEARRTSAMNRSGSGRARSSSSVAFSAEVSDADRHKSANSQKQAFRNPATAIAMKSEDKDSTMKSLLEKAQNIATTLAKPQLPSSASKATVGAENAKEPNPRYTIDLPPVKTPADLNEVALQIRRKYEEFCTLRIKLEERQHIFAELYEEYREAKAECERVAEAKRKQRHAEDDGNSENSFDIASLNPFDPKSDNLLIMCTKTTTISDIRKRNNRSLDAKGSCYIMTQSTSSNGTERYKLTKINKKLINRNIQPSKGGSGNGEEDITEVSLESKINESEGKGKKNSRWLNPEEARMWLLYMDIERAFEHWDGDDVERWIKRYRKLHYELKELESHVWKSYEKLSESKPSSNSGNNNFKPISKTKDDEDGIVLSLDNFKLD